MAEHGCSVHFVTEELDGGPLVVQAVSSGRVRGLSHRAWRNGFTPRNTGFTRLQCAGLPKVAWFSVTSKAHCWTASYLRPAAT
jgi:hypothetical protein